MVKKPQQKIYRWPRNLGGLKIRAFQLDQLHILWKYHTSTSLARTDIWPQLWQVWHENLTFSLLSRTYISRWNRHSSLCTLTSNALESSPVFAIPMYLLSSFFPSFHLPSRMIVKTVNFCIPALLVFFNFIQNSQMFSSPYFCYGLWWLFGLFIAWISFHYWVWVWVCVFTYVPACN